MCASCGKNESVSKKSFIRMSYIVETASQGKSFLYCGVHALRIDSVAPGNFNLSYSLQTNSLTDNKQKILHYLIYNI